MDTSTRGAPCRDPTEKQNTGNSRDTAVEATGTLMDVKSRNGAQNNNMDVSNSRDINYNISNNFKSNNNRNTNNRRYRSTSRQHVCNSRDASKSWDTCKSKEANKSIDPTPKARQYQQDARKSRGTNNSCVFRKIHEKQ